jgi:hypothetical protein
VKKSDTNAGASEAGSPAQLQAEIDEARDNLAANLTALREQTSPEALVRRGRATVTGFFTDEYGGIRPERVAMVAGVVVTLVVLRRWRRSRRCSCR